MNIAVQEFRLAGLAQACAFPGLAPRNTVTNSTKNPKVSCICRKQSNSGVCARLLQLCPTLQVYGPTGSCVHGILQARILAWVAMPSSRGSFDPGVEPMCPTLAGEFSITRATWEAPALGPQGRI